MAADSRATLRDLVFHYSGFVKSPLQWTSHHFDLVGCRFEDMTMAPFKGASTKEKCRSQKRRNDQTWREAENFPKYIIYSQKCESLASILVGEKRAFANYRRGPSFYFQGRLVHRPHYTVFNRHEQSLCLTVQSPPLIGYLHYSSVNGDRRKQFQPCRGPKGMQNTIGVKLCLKKLDQLTPKDWTADPYFLCHLLALAQWQVRQFSGLRGRNSYTSRLLVTNIQHRDFILLCEAEIPIEVLEGLENPKLATNYIIWPTIHRKQIPFQPYSTFADRLAADLIAPPLSENAMLKHDKNGPAWQTSGAPKKKRPIPCYLESEELERQKRIRK